MKGIGQAALVAAMVARALAQPHQHQHQHLPHDNEVKASPLEKRANGVITTVVPGPTVIEYVLEGEHVDNQVAEHGVSDGSYIIIGETTPTFIPPPAAPPTSTTYSASSSSTQSAGQFFESKSTTTLPTSTTPSTSAAPSPTRSVAATVGIDSNFPKGTIPCSHFPAEYGPIPVAWLNNQGWTSIQIPDVLIPGVQVKSIVTPTTGGCLEGALCSFACPAGYQKSQWPETSQGASGQSVGGLLCKNGFLELTRPTHPKLCEPGAGGVFIQNNLSGQSSVCRTDYPSTEAMVIPLTTTPGGTFPLTNPASTSYYMWKGNPTTAQYYVNNLNVAVEDACCWDSLKFPLSAGNWAPLNIGTGQADDGNTYISLFANSPTSTALLDFNIEITGDTNAPCWYKSGRYYGGGNGCTTALPSGGQVTIVFSH